MVAQWFNSPSPPYLPPLYTTAYLLIHISFVLLLFLLTSLVVFFTSSLFFHFYLPSSPSPSSFFFFFFYSWSTLLIYLCPFHLTCHLITFFPVSPLFLPHTSFPVVKQYPTKTPPPSFCFPHQFSFQSPAPFILNPFLLCARAANENYLQLPDPSPSLRVHSPSFLILHFCSSSFFQTGSDPK